MGSKTFDGVRLQIYSDDHLPPHLHGFLSGVAVIVDLLPDGDTRLSERSDAISPSNAARNVRAKILRVANENAGEMMQLWEAIHGAR